MSTARASRRPEWLASAPSFLWMLVLFALPAANLFLMAFRPADVTGGVGKGWTWEAWSVLAQPGMMTVVLRTVWITATVVVGCMLLSVPVAWRICQASARWRPWLLMLVVLPFWTSFLIRVYAWRVLLQSNGPLASALKSLHLLGEDGVLLYNSSAVVVVMVYTYLPMAVLPVYAAIEKFDFTLMEAARDLGASAWQAFYRVVLPGIRRGMIAGALLVGVPCLGSYVVPEMIGGVDAEMLGTKIGQRLFSDRNLPQAAALAAALACLAMPAVVLAIRRKKEDVE